MKRPRNTSQTRSGTEREEQGTGSPPGKFSHLAEGETDWAALEAMTPEEAHQNALDDPDAQPLTPEQRRRFRRVPNPKEMRQRMGLTQEEFARRYEIALGTLRDWEQGARILDSTAKAYLRVIEKNPEAVAEALALTYDRAEADGPVTSTRR
jgi:putative transcriptional regulator